MTAEEMGREFDLLYNNIMSNAAPGIDEYEKSLFLTKAQEQFVTTIYDGTFEGSEKLRECISPLVTTETYDSNASISGHTALDKNSKFFAFPEDAWYILYEELSPKDSGECTDGIGVVVKPVKLDEYYRISRNPFRRARKREALRINTDGLLEIISIYPSYEYKLKYLKRPEPIIIHNDDAAAAGIEIDGCSMGEDKDCQLLEAIHRPIVEAAVALAVAAYKSTNQ